MSKKPVSKAAQGKKQNIIVISMAVFTIAIAALSTAYFSGALSFGGDSGAGNAYKNVTFTDAVLSCKGRVRDEFDERLSSMVVDSHSSRYDDSDSSFKIFLSVDARGKSSTADKFFVNCYVSSGSGRIKEFESFEDKEETKSKVIRRDGDKLFQWPSD